MIIRGKGTSKTLILCAGILMFTIISMTSISLAKVIITVAYPHPPGTPYGEALEAVIKSFNSSQSEIQAKGMFIPYENIAQSKLLVMAAGGAPPDVALVADLLIAEYAVGNVIIPLQPFIDRDKVSPQDYWPSSWGVCNWEGKQWAMPHTQDCRGLDINTARFEEAGISKVPETLEDFAVAMMKLTKQGPDRKYSHIGFIPWAGEGLWFYTWGWHFGGDFYDRTSRKVTANHPKNIEAMSWLLNYSLKVIPYDTPYTLWTDLYSGRLATIIDGNWNFTYHKNSAPDVDLDFVPIPPKRGEKLSTWSGIWTMVIPKGTKHPDAAWEFIRYATGIEGSLVYAKYGEIMANRVAVEKMLPEYLKMHGSKFKTVVQLMPYSHARPTMPVGSFYWDQLVAAVRQVMSGKVPPREALDQVTKTVQAKLDKALGK